MCEHVKLVLSFHIFICAHMGMLENMCNVHVGLAENSSKLTMDNIICAYIFRLNKCSIMISISIWLLKQIIETSDVTKFERNMILR